MNTVFPYPGGKSYMAEWIIGQFPDHHCYVEPFGGGASVLVNKPQSNVEVYNDRDGDIIHFFKVLRDQTSELVSWLRQRPYAKDLHEKYGRGFYSGYRPENDVERAGRFFYLRRAQYAGKYRTMSGFSSGQKRNSAISYQNALDALRDFADRFKDVIIENRDYEVILDRFDNESTLFYCDPPYVEEGDALYTGPDFDQNRFINAVDGVDGYVCLSYTDLPPGLDDWTVLEKDMAQHMNKGHGGNRADSRTERLVVNFDPDNTPVFKHAGQRSVNDF